METKQHKEQVEKSKRIPYDEAKIIVNDFRSRVRFCFLDKKCIRLKTIPVGSYRRKKETLKDVDFIIIYPPKYSRHKNDIINSIKLVTSKTAQIKSLTFNSKMHGTMHSQFIAKLYNHPNINFMIDVFLVPEESYPFALFHYTGSKTFNIRTRAYVKRYGMLLNQYGLYDAKTGKKIKSEIATERDLFNYLNITYKTPQQRSE